MCVINKLNYESAKFKFSLTLKEELVGVNMQFLASAVRGKKAERPHNHRGGADGWR